MSRKEIESLYKNELAITDPSEIDIEAIAYFKGASVKWRPLKGCEARIVGFEDRAIISVNSNSSYERSRFSIGHELGHWFKHRGSVGNLCQKNDVQPNRTSLTKSVSGKEKIANEYAVEFLMPSYLFIEHIRGSEISFDVIKSIKDTFKVSLTAAAIRYLGFCDFPVILCCYGQSKRKWFHRSIYVPDYFYPVRALPKLSFGNDSSHLNQNTQAPIEVDADVWIDVNGVEQHEVFQIIWQIGKDDKMVFIWWKDDWHSSF